MLQRGCFALARGEAVLSVGSIDVTDAARLASSTIVRVRRTTMRLLGSLVCGYAARDMLKAQHMPIIACPAADCSRRSWRPAR